MAGGWQLDQRRLFVFPPNVPERVAHFADGGIRAHGIEQWIHGIALAAGGFPQCIERKAHLVVVARCPQRFEPRELAVRRTVVDRSEERRVGKECRSRWSPY